MNLPQRTPLRPSRIERFGPLAAIAAVIVVIAGLAVLSGRDGNETTDRSPTAKPASGESSQVPITYQQASERGELTDHQWVENCDPKTGRIRMPIVTAYPCVPRFTAGSGNGGPTYQGVTDTAIKVVFYRERVGGDVMSRLEGVKDSPDQVVATARDYVEMMNDLAQLYGRKVELVEYQAQGEFSNAQEARLDAQRIIEQFHPFAVIRGPVATDAFAYELASNNVVCIDCSVILPDDLYHEFPGRLWSTTAMPVEWLHTFGPFLGELEKRNAEFAGSPDLRSKPRKIGIVRMASDPPTFEGLLSAITACVPSQRGNVNETYTLANMNQRAPLIIQKLIQEGVTTIVFLGDPLMPMQLTSVATKQNYFPEWVVAGTAGTDKSLWGRKYDPQQWSHAFGLSQLSVPLPPEKRESRRVHEWYFGRPPVAEKSSYQVWPSMHQLFLGLHLAGPALTPETFAQGMFNFPATSGAKTEPGISWGSNGLFSKWDNAESCQSSPMTDYQAIDDMVEIFWDRDAVGPDESGVSGPGLWRYVAGGERLRPGKARVPAPFSKETSVLSYNDFPEGERPPEYPPPRAG